MKRIVYRMFVTCVASIGALAQTSNPIVLENQQPGTSQWQLNISPYLVSDDVNKQIKGYASATSVNKGQSITFYVTVTPAQTYTIDIYRIGWYQGLGGRFMQRIGPLSGTNQAPCPPSADTGLIECAWTPGTTFTVPATWTTGVYMALLTNSQNYQNYINFVVRDDSSHSALLYQESVNTNQAYNNYPDDNATGKSLYDFNSNGANTVVGSKRAAKVSFNRPYADDGASPFLAWEVYFVQWLEDSGYDVSYSTDVDTHTTGGQILNHKAFLSVGHNEYWSKQMRDAVEQARDSGVNVGFFGADPVYWQVRLEQSPMTLVPNRVVVCYKSQQADPVQGITTTVLWRDPFINLPEQTLIGVMYTAQNVASYNNPPDTYVVTNSSNWVYAGTGFTDGSTVPHIVGYEVDRYQSQYPSPVSVNGTYALLSHSPVVDVNLGTADYANSSIYQAPSGAWVFGAGTVDWGWGLSRSGFIDARIQQTTNNILNRFIGSSSSPPVVVSQSPTAGATGVSTSTAVSATFNRSMLASTFTSSTFTLHAAGASSNVAASIAVSGATATLTPASALAAGTTYTATVAGTVTDTNGIALGTTATWTFTTASAATPPVILSQSPAAGATGVSTSTAVSVTFNRSMLASTFTSSTFTLRAAGASSNVAASIAVSGATATLTPSSALAAGTVYTATVAGTVTDTNGIALGTAATWTFTTQSSAGTNLLVSPNDITNPAWQVYGSGCSATNANTFTYSTSSCTLYQVVNVSPNTTYTASVTLTLASGKGDYVTNGLFTTSFGSLCTSSAAVISSTPSVKACTVSSGANTKVQIEIDTGGTAAGSMTISGATLHQ